MAKEPPRAANEAYGDPQNGDPQNALVDPESAHQALVKAILQNGDIEPLGRMPWSSNITLLCNVSFEGNALQAIYKPGRGERSLWDFPDGLYHREVACYRLCEVLRWPLVPPTVLRAGPVGPGSLQLFIQCDFDKHYFDLRDRVDLRFAFQRLVAFDYVVNSTDRKSGHVLLANNTDIWAIDNGLTFHVDFKLRTVLWDFADQDVPKSILADLGKLTVAQLSSKLSDLLSKEEIVACAERARQLADHARFPLDPTGRGWPWPLV